MCCLGTGGTASLLKRVPFPHRHLFFQLIIAVTICNGPQVSCIEYTLYLPVEAPQVKKVSVESLSIDVRARMGGGDVNLILAMSIISKQLLKPFFFW